MSGMTTNEREAKGEGGEERGEERTGQAETKAMR
jgi:hypothetical protein